MIKAIAIDDEPLALKVIQHHCDKLPYLNLEKTFTNQSEAIKYLERFPVELLFLDIQMPEKNGLNFYKQLSQKPLVIFTTAYNHYAVEGFNVNAVDYILKPIGFDRFKTATDKALFLINQKTQSIQEQYLFLRADYKLHKISWKDILYIESLDDYLIVHFENQPKLTTKMSLKAILEKLPKEDFIRIHRSYILPVHKITSFQNKVVFINNLTFPIGETYRNNVIFRLNTN